MNSAEKKWENIYIGEINLKNVAKIMTNIWVTLISALIVEGDCHIAFSYGSRKEATY